MRDELAHTDDYEAAFARYENEMRDLVHASRAFALGVAKTLIPTTRAGVWGLVRGMQLVTSLPSWLVRPLAKLNSKGVRLHDSMVVRDYGRQGDSLPAPRRSSTKSSGSGCRRTIRSRSGLD